MKLFKVFLVILSLILIVSGCGNKSGEIVRTENTMYTADDTNPKTFSGSSEEEKAQQEDAEKESSNDAGSGIDYTPTDEYDLAPLIGQYFREQEFLDKYKVKLESEASSKGGRSYDGSGVTITTNADNQIYDITLGNEQSEFNLYGITFGMYFDEAKKIVDSVATDIEFDSGEGSYNGMVSPDYCLRVATDNNQAYVTYVRLVRW